MKISKATIGNVTGGIVGGILLGVGIGMIAYGFKCSQLQQDFVLPGTFIMMGGVTALFITTITITIQEDKYLGKKLDENLRKKLSQWQEQQRSLFDKKL